MSYQVMPDLTVEEYAALRASVAADGFRTPVDVDEHGVILDGHHRAAVAAELGIDCPTRVVAGLDEAGKREHALAVNVQRRQLSREQRRELVAAELERDPDRSDRAIARLTGVDHKTVGAMRRGAWGIPQPDRATGTDALADSVADLFAPYGAADRTSLHLRDGLTTWECLRVGARLYSLAGTMVMPWEGDPDAEVIDFRRHARILYVIAVLEDPRGVTEERFARLCNSDVPHEEHAPDSPCAECDRVNAAMEANFCALAASAVRVSDDQIRWWLGDYWNYEERHWTRLHGAAG